MHTKHKHHPITVSKLSVNFNIRLSLYICLYVTVHNVHPLNQLNAFWKSYHKEKFNFHFVTVTLQVTSYVYIYRMNIEG